MSIKRWIRAAVVIVAAFVCVGQLKLNLLIVGISVGRTDDRHGRTRPSRRGSSYGNARLDTTRHVGKVPGEGLAKINAAYALRRGTHDSQGRSKLMEAFRSMESWRFSPKVPLRSSMPWAASTSTSTRAWITTTTAANSTSTSKKGPQHLTGSQVAGYVRFRHDAASDFGRVKRQQQVLKLYARSTQRAAELDEVPRF